MSFVVAQLGARMHYAAPRIFFNAGLLRRLYTDCYVAPSRLLRLMLPARVRRKTERYNAKLPEAMVRYNNRAGLWTKLTLARAKSALTVARAGVRAARWLANDVIADQTSGARVGVYGFDTAAMELFRWGEARGHYLVLEQCVAPRRTQERVLSSVLRDGGAGLGEEEMAAWRLLAEREREEWEMADLIVCPSAYVREELIHCGVSFAKIAVVPYGVTQPAPDSVEASVARRSKKVAEPMRVLFAGEVGLRKGAGTLARAAERLAGANVEIVAAGAVNLPAPLTERVLRKIHLLGKRTRLELENEYAKADCFVLPSHLEGSATVTYEALSWGLPVVTTFSSGSVVEDGKSGFVGKAGDVDFLVSGLERLSRDRALRQTMSVAARARGAEFTLDKYGDRLLRAVATREALS